MSRGGPGCAARVGGPPSALTPVALSSCVRAPVALSNNTVPREEPCLLSTGFFGGREGDFCRNCAGTSQVWLMATSGTGWESGPEVQTPC